MACSPQAFQGPEPGPLLAPPGMLLIATEIPSGTNGKTSENEQGQTRSRPLLVALCPASRPGAMHILFLPEGEAKQPSRRGSPSHAAPNQCGGRPPEDVSPATCDGGLVGKRVCAYGAQ